VKHTRTITALFTDVVGSTELLTRLGHDAADELRTHHFAAMRAALAVHRGDEVKTLGDGFMAVFDSTSDALSCAVTMQRATVEPGARGGDAVSIRVGVSAGEATEEAGDWFGVPIVEASRLCAAAEAGQVLTSELVRLLVGSAGMHRFEPLAPIMLKGLPEPVPVCELCWDGDDDESALKVAIADDSVLLRQGIARALEAEGVEIVLEASDAQELFEGLPAADPDVVLLDVRMPPTHTTEGLDAGVRIRAEHPGIGVLVLSAAVQASAAEQLLSDTTEGVGYLLKDRVADIGELLAAIRSVASGGSAIDPEVVAQLAPAA
jgi:class 3 adenylate cyclase/CheY-like chemotaxis protein